MVISRMLVFLLGVLVVGQVTIAATDGTITVKNRVVRNPAVNGPLLPWGSGKIASAGGLSAFLYRTESSGDWLYLYDGAGNGSHMQLPGTFDLNDRANAEYVLTSPDELWVWSGVLGKAALRRYRLSRSGNRPVPDRASLVSVRSVGDSDTCPGGLLRLASGGVVGVWHQYKTYPDRRLDTGFIHVRPGGDVTVNFPVPVAGSEGTPVAARWALVQHPSDGSIWAFLKRDSYHEISALHLTETAEGITLDWVKTDFIGRKDGRHEPEGEYPYLVAVADSGDGSIVLAYQNNRSEILYVTDGDGNMLNGNCRQQAGGQIDPYFFAKRSSVSIVRIADDGEKTFRDFPAFVERTHEFGLSLTGRLWVLYRRIDCETITYEMLQRRGEVMLRHYDGRWSEPLMLGTLDVRKDYYGASLFSSPYRPHFLMRLDDGLLHLFEAAPDS